MFNANVQHYEDAADKEAVALALKADRKFLVGRVALRTLFMDDNLLAACKRGARQVYLLQPNAHKLTGCAY